MWRPFKELQKNTRNQIIDFLKERLNLNQTIHIEGLMDYFDNNDEHQLCNILYVTRVMDKYYVAHKGQNNESEDFTPLDECGTDCLINIADQLFSKI